ncbi:hypothetical protein F4859DRAFT_252108 [Xylaria cf. heliscus]|nr:hypothetical protein F4859DRAFT_252108 [Xylaria cf. heliscus]
MAEPNSVQLLTEENLKKLRAVQKQQLPSESLTSSDFLPIDKLEKEKRRVYLFFSRIRDLGAEGDRIRDAEDVYIADGQQVRYRGNAIPEPDLQDPSFWEAKLLYLQQTYGPGIKLARARRGVCHYMTLLHDFGREGRNILADYELNLVGKNDVRYRGNADPNPDLEDSTYWEAQRVYLRSIHEKLWKARYPSPPPARHRSPNTEEKKKYAEQQNLIEDDKSTDALWAWSKRKREIRAWSNAQPAGKRYVWNKFAMDANMEQELVYRDYQSRYFMVRQREALRPMPKMALVISRKRHVILDGMRHIRVFTKGW